MADGARAFFEELPSRLDPVRTAGLDHSYVFDIDGVGAWTVRVSDGAVAVSEGAEDADCTISASEETFARIVRGEQSPTTAYVTGKLRVAGDVGAALKLAKLL